MITKVETANRALIRLNLSLKHAPALELDVDLQITTHEKNNAIKSRIDRKWNGEMPQLLSNPSIKKNNDTIVFAFAYPYRTGFPLLYIYAFICER